MTEHLDLGLEVCDSQLDVHNIFIKGFEKFEQFLMLSPITLVYMPMIYTT